MQELSALLSLVKNVVGYLYETGEDGSYISQLLGCFGQAHDQETYLLWINSMYCGYRGWYQNSSVREVKIPDEVSYINDYCFSGCGRLGSVSIPDSVLRIGHHALYGAAIEQLVIPNSVRVIEYAAVYNCTLLKKVTIAVDTIVGFDTFYQYSYDKKRDVKSTTIKTLTFTSGDTGLSVPAVWSGFNTSAVETVVFEEGVKSIGEGWLQNCHELSSLTLPSTLETIGRDAFWGCEKLSSVVLPESLKAIDAAAFDVECETNFVVTKGSYAEKWAIENAHTYSYAKENTPAKPSIAKLTAGIKSFTVKVAKQAGVDGFDISYKQGAGKWKTTSCKGSALNKRVSGLKKGKKYRVKVRAYVSIGTTKLYSAWSKIKTVKTK